MRALYYAVCLGVCKSSIYASEGRGDSLVCVDVRKSSVTRNFITNWRDVVVDILLTGFVAVLMFIQKIAERFDGTG